MSPFEASSCPISKADATGNFRETLPLVRMPEGREVGAPKRSLSKAFSWYELGIANGRPIRRYLSDCRGRVGRGYI